MHHIYHTDGFVLEGRNTGEANKFFSLFTREMGLIDASAQGIRQLKSKLRPSLCDFSYCDFSLVKGKNNWKITGAVLHFNLHDCIRESAKGNSEIDFEKIIVCGNIFRLLKRLLSGEEKNKTLFSVIFSALSFLKNMQLTSEELRNAECVIVLSILHELGYVGKEIQFDKFINNMLWSKEILGEMSALRPKFLATINQSLKESQL
jgi:DNA repair protein RecO (recombination protein O)